MAEKKEKQDNRKRCLLLIDEAVATRMKILALEEGTTFSQYMENLAREEITKKDSLIKGRRMHGDDRDRLTRISASKGSEGDV